MSTTFAAAVTVLIGMFLLGLFIALWSWAHSYDRQLKSQLAVRVYFCTTSQPGCKTDANKQQENDVAARLQGDPRISRIKFVSKEDAYNIMKKRQPEAVNALPANPFPDKLEITPKRGELTPVIGQELRNANLSGVQPGKDGVDWGATLTKRVLHVTRIVETFFIAAAILLILASTLLIANTIRLSIFSRRREIEVMKLVGATNAFVRLPFMLEGMLTGLLGAVGALGLLTVVYFALNGWERGLTDPARLVGVPLLIGMLAAFGLLLGAFGSGLTLRRFLRV